MHFNRIAKAALLTVTVAMAVSVVPTSGATAEAGHKGNGKAILAIL